MPKIVIATTEPLPLPGLPTTGAGLRAWGLAEGLRNAGLDVTLLMPDNAMGGSMPPAELARALEDAPIPAATFRRGDLTGAVRRLAPDALVLQHWGLAAELKEPGCPLAIDLAGPHLLERRLWGTADPEGDLNEKLDALRRADFLTASGARQRLYFLPYLALAGWDIAPPGVLPVIPYSLAPVEPPAPSRGDRFIHGGFFLPWQDPSAVLECAMVAMDLADRGELLFVGGPHPTRDVSGGRFEPLLTKLRAHPRVRVLDPMPYDDYSALLAEGGIALDLMARNAEREIAFTTRTVVYLAHGLPVIHDDYSELGALIREEHAGWALDPADREAITAMLAGFLSGELNPAPLAANARRVVADFLHWHDTIGPLAQWCRNPVERPQKAARRLAFEERARRLRELEQRLEANRAELATLRGKRWVRWGLSLTGGNGVWTRAPLAAFAAVAGLLLIPVFWLSDRAARRKAPPNKA